MTKQPHELEKIARALTAWRSDEAAGFLAEHFGKKPVRKHASEYFTRYPTLAASALGPIAAGKGRGAAMAQELLDGLARAEAVEAAGGEGEAPLEALPSVLVAPPWDGGPRPKRRVIVVPDPPALDGPVAVHGTLPPLTHSMAGPTSFPTMTDAEATAWEARARAAEAAYPGGDRGMNLWYDYAAKRAVPREVRLRVFSDGWRHWMHSELCLRILEESGLDAMPGVVRWAIGALADSPCPGVHRVRYLSEVETPELAVAMARAARRRPLRAFARDWLQRHTEAAIAGLLPVAVGPKGADRTTSELALRDLARRGHEARIRARAKELGGKGPAAVDEILGWDPIADCPKKPPKLSARYRPEALVRPTLADGRPLPIEAVRRLGEMLAFTDREETYVGIEAVAEVCDPRSLAEHAWSLATAWEASGARNADAWMMFSLVHLADDEVVRRTTPALKHGAVVEVLQHLGTDAAAMELATVAARAARTEGALWELAEAALDRIAAERAITRDELDEVLTPTLELDAHGGLELDYGPRRVVVRFDEHLDPYFEGKDGAPTRMLPRARKTDDAAKVALAKARWEELKEDIGAIGAMRAEALERAMLSGAEWPRARFEERWVRQPLVVHLARRLVLARVRGDARATFRIAEDSTYRDVDDEPFELADGDRVVVPHVLSWPDDTLERWCEVFDDYEIVQPFAQLHRAIPTFAPGERAEPIVKRPLGGSFFALRRRLARSGWEVVDQSPALRVDGGFTVQLGSLSDRTGQFRTIVLWRDSPREQAPWAEVDEAVLVRVLDALGYHGET
ncbi:MAG: DUF4132 domain-containing protein [Sandaracinaceae bacterium]